jgi:hypothetical protein
LTSANVHAAPERVSRFELARRVQALAITATEHKTLPTSLAREPRLAVGDISTSEGIAPSKVRRVVYVNVQPLLDCYATSLREEDDPGFAHLEVWLGVDASGQTVYAEAMTATASIKTATCVEAVFAELEFPAADVPLRAIDVSLYFQPARAR